MQPKWRSFFAGLLILFIIYHFPEFFSALWIAAVFKIGFLLVAYVIARRQGWKGLGGFGLMLHHGWIKNLLLGLATGIIFFLFSEWLSIRRGYEQLLSVKTSIAIIKLLPLTLLMTFFPSIAEDILTRGYLYGHLQKVLRPAVLVLLSAVFYVLNHIWRLGQGAPVLSYLFILGIALTLALIFTNSLWLTLGIHWGSNIAFEMVNASTTTNTLNQTMSIWMLAASFAIMVLFITLSKRALSRCKQWPARK